MGSVAEDIYDFVVVGAGELRFQTMAMSKSMTFFK